MSSISYARNEQAHRAELAIRVSAKLPSHGLLVAKHRASGSRFRDQSVLLVGYFALHIAHRAAALHDPSLRCESSLPYRSKEIDFQLDGSEGFLRRKSACECLPLAASAMSHRIPPCSGPMGFACRGSAEKVAVARPSAISFASKPSAAVRELRFRDIPPGGGRQSREHRPPSAGDAPCSFLPGADNQHRQPSCISFMAQLAASFPLVRALR